MILFNPVCMAACIVYQLWVAIISSGLPLTGLILEAPFNNIIDVFHFHPFSKVIVIIIKKEKSLTVP